MAPDPLPGRVRRMARLLERLRSRGWTQGAATVSAAPLMGDRITEAIEEPTYTLFAWVQVTPNVRAGYRLPATRPEPFRYTADVPKSMYWQGMTLEITHRSGRRVRLWSTGEGFTRHANEGDALQFTLQPEWRS